MLVRNLYFLLSLLLCMFLYMPAAFGGSGTVQDPYRIYMVLWRGETMVERGFTDYFRDRGIAIEVIVRNLDRDLSRAEKFITEARSLQPDLIYTWGTSATLAMRGRFDAQENSTDEQKYLADIPGVFTLVAYPKEAGIVADYRTPNRNLTGVLFLAPVQAQFGLMNAYLAPNDELSKLAAIYNPQEKNARINMDILRQYAAAADIDLHIEPMPIITVTEEGKTYKKPDTKAIPEIFKKFADSGRQFVYIGADSYMTRKIKQISEASVDYGIPLFVATEAAIVAEDSLALLSLTTPYYNLGQLTAYQAQEILVGGKSPHNIPVRSLSEFNILLNTQAMQRLNYFPPIELLLDAQFVNTAEPGANNTKQDNKE